MDTQVLIVGAGPVGLTLANELVRRNIHCRVIDRAAGPAQQSRALVVHCRTQELLQVSGLRDTIAARAIPLRGLRLDRGLDEIATIPFDLGTYPALSLPQRQTEAALRTALEARAVEVEWGVELVELRQDANQVVATTTGEPVRASFLAGCDGAHSTVRHLLEIPFQGESLPETLWMADAAMDWDLAPDHGHQFMHPDGMLTAIPMPGERWRLVTLAADGDGEPDARFFEAAVVTRTGRTPRRMAIDWFSSFRVNCRLAASYRLDRTFLAGDAAHVHSPIGGQGMNVGMQDAFHLSSRLAAAIACDADDAALAQYEAERRPAAAAVIKANARISRLAAATGPLPRFARNHLMPNLMRLPPINRRVGLEASGLLRSGLSHRL